MTVAPCAKCAGDQVEMRTQIRKAERNHRRGVSTAAPLARIAKLKADLAACDHAGMARATAATSARHAAARGGAA